jgi:DNA-binding beta-propeller fold protein YncE
MTTRARWASILLLVAALVPGWPATAPAQLDPGDLLVSSAATAFPAVLSFDAPGAGTLILALPDGLESPRGLAIDPGSGDLFIADAAAAKVFRWNPVAGLSVFADALDGIGVPVGLAFGAGGALFVSNADNAAPSVLRFDAAGTGTTILSPALGHPLGSPRGLAVDPVSGDLFIADAAAEKIFRWNGAILTVFADAADAIGVPEGLAFAATGQTLAGQAILGIDSIRTVPCH